jgi:iron complex transport system ATP-binding protein
MNLQIERLGFSYDGDRLVLDGLDLVVDAGQLLCVVGPNGSGKSTLLALCAGLFAPSTGSVRWDGGELSAWKGTERARHVAFLPQQLPAIAGHSVEEVVRLGRFPHLAHPWARLGRLDEEAVVSALEQTEAMGLRARTIDSLSGGERQRAYLAAALAQGGELLLLDEPTAALDLHHQIAGMRLLRRLAGGAASSAPRTT